MRKSSPRKRTDLSMNNEKRGHENEREQMGDWREEGRNDVIYYDLI